MKHNLLVDNDSGYVSHTQETTTDSTVDTTYKQYSAEEELYLSEDALLEKPNLEHFNISCKKSKHLESIDSVFNSSQESVKTEFSGFEDSDTSSVIISPQKPIMWRTSDEKEDIGHTKSFVNESHLVKAHKALVNVTNTYDQNPNPSFFKSWSTDKENIPPTVTPTKNYENRFNADISPDLFEEDEEKNGVKTAQKSPTKKDVATNNYCRKDEKLLKTVQSSLNGVHPPPSVTIVQMSVQDMLDKIDKNKDLFWKASSTVTTKCSKSLLINDKPDCVSFLWPEILKYRFHGLHYNRSKTSEEMEHLCLKHAERYIGAETQSSCTVFEAEPSSSLKRKTIKPRWGGAKSPGRRLSHLARRRITFSSSSLQANSSSAILGSRTNQILVDARKLSMLKKSPRKSPRRTPSKSPFKIKKKTPSSSAKKKLALRFREMSGEFESIPSCSTTQSMLNFKRALFSNENDSGSFGGSLEKKSTKRALFSSPLKPSSSKYSPTKLGRKRKRTDSDSSNPVKLSKSMSFDICSAKSESVSMNRSLSESFTSKCDVLSEQHKKKLQWAVYESLRLQNVTSTHPQFKEFASVLAKVTRKFLPSLRFEGRTTEKMFKIARQHSYAVVKGKNVDEIIKEFVRSKVKSQRLRGYVSSEAAKEKEDKENVARNKVNIIESIEKRREHAGSDSKFLNQNRIDQIKKVISFEEKQT